MNEGESPDAGRAAPPGRALLGLMAAVLHIALVVLAWGVMSFVLDRDVIGIPDAGPLIGPTMVATAAALVFWLVLRGRTDRPIGGVAPALLGSMIIAPFTAALALALGSATPTAFLVYFGGFVLSPFTVVAALIAGAVVPAFSLVGRPR